MFDPRLRSSFALAVAMAFGACHSPSSSYDLSLPQDSSTDQDPDDLSERGRRDSGAGPGDASVMHQDAHVQDASGTPRDASSTSGDAGSTSGDAGSTSGDAGSTGGGAGFAGRVSCYSDGFPSTTCALPTHCCFTNYSAQHNGSCMSSACTWGTIECDGPEDCGRGQHCCAHAIIDPDDGMTGYVLACQTSACGAAPVNQELCHPASSPAGTCSGERTCVTPASLSDYDLPQTLYVCH